MNKWKELRLIEELMVDLINKDNENSEEFDKLQDRQFELLTELEID